MTACGGRSSKSGFQGAAVTSSRTLDPHGGARRSTPPSVWHYGPTLLGPHLTSDSSGARIDHRPQRGHPQGASIRRERVEGAVHLLGEGEDLRARTLHSGFALGRG